MNVYEQRIRWGVFENYFGKIIMSDFVCFCDSISQAAHIIDALTLKCSGRPIHYKAIKIADDYIDYLDDVIQYDLFGEFEADYSKYLEGISCLGVVENGN